MTQPGLAVLVGVERWLILHERICLAPGLGQLWLTVEGEYVVCRWDITGKTVWSICTIGAARHYVLASGRAGILFQNGVVIGLITDVKIDTDDGWDGIK